VFDAVVWGLDWRGSPKAALKKVAVFGKRLSAAVGEIVARGIPAESEQQLQRHVESLEAIGGQAWPFASSVRASKRKL